MYVVPQSHKTVKGKCPWIKGIEHWNVDLSWKAERDVFNVKFSDTLGEGEEKLFWIRRTKNLWMWNIKKYFVYMCVFEIGEEFVSCFEEIFVIRNVRNRKRLLFKLKSLNL